MRVSKTCWPRRQRCVDSAVERPRPPRAVLRSPGKPCRRPQKIDASLPMQNVGDCRGRLCNTPIARTVSSIMSTLTNKRHRPNLESTGKPSAPRPVLPASSGAAAGRSATGTVSMTPRGFAFVNFDMQVETHTECFVPPRLLKGVLDADRVCVKFRVDNFGRSTATHLSVTANSRTELVGRAKVAGDGRVTMTPDPHVGNSEWHLDPAGLDIPAGSAVLASIGKRGKASAIKIWENPHCPDAIRTAALVRNRVDLGRPAGADRAAERLTALDGKTPRVDLRKEVTFTIDADSSKDLDDALTVFPPEPDGSIRVQVHISDVAAHLPLGSPVDQDARRVATSVYLPGWTRPMLPAALSEDALSLLPGCDRDALTVDYTVAGDGKLSEVAIRASRVRSNIRINYEDATAVLVGRRPSRKLPRPVTEALRNAGVAAGRLSSARRGKGQSVQVATPAESLVVVTDSKVSVRAVNTAVEQAGRDLIEQLMVATNESVATWLAQRGLQGMFRVHSGPDETLGRDLAPLLKQLKVSCELPQIVTPTELATINAAARSVGDRAARAVQDVTLQHMTRAYYSPQRADHFGLASEGYVHFTSPVRRYADVVVHRIVHRELSGSTGKKRKLSSLADHINVASGAAARTESQTRRALWLSTITTPTATHPVALHGWVSRVGQRGVTVTIDGGLGFGTVPFSNGDRQKADHGSSAGRGAGTLQIGQRVTVSPSVIDVESGLLELRVTSPPSGGNHGSVKYRR